MQIRGIKIKLNIFRIIVLLISIYLFYINCPYWYDKLQVLTANEINTTWIPKEFVNSKSVWGDTLSQKNDLLILPYGERNFTVYYDTEYFSMSGFWSAIPKVSFSEKNNLSYTIKTVDPIHVSVYSDATNQTRKVQPYLKFSLNSNKELLHKVVTVYTVMELEFPQKKEMSFNFEYVKGTVEREFKLLFVSPDEYLSIKKLFDNDIPEMIVTPYIRAFISLLFLALIILNIKSLFRKSSYDIV